MPPPPVKTGSPASPSRRYTPQAAAPFFPPRSTPARVVNRNCSVIGHTGMGMRIYAPAIIRAVNRGIIVRSFVFMGVSFFSGYKYFTGNIIPRPAGFVNQKW